MVWRKTRVFKCDICKAEKPAEQGVYLPIGWTGSEKKNEPCICDWCNSALKKIKKEVRECR